MKLHLLSKIFLQFPIPFAPPHPEGPCIGAAWGKEAVKQGAEKVYFLAIGAQAEAVFVHAAQAGFLVKELAGSAKVYRHFAGTG